MKLKPGDSENCSATAGDGSQEPERDEEKEKKKRKKKKKKSCKDGGSEVGGELVGAGGTRSEKLIFEEDKSSTKSQPRHMDGAVCRNEDAKTGGDMSACPSPTDSGISSIGGVETVVKEFIELDFGGGVSDQTPVAVAKEVMSIVKEVDTRKRKLHVCAYCGLAETVAKSFKRCQK